ncbi:MAG: selenide, water dikinase SelD, partial [Ardenticatenaceae bacterium]
DPFAFGEIAVANALSDVYAMGGRPLLALNIVGFPVGLPKNILGEILKGGASKAKEAGVLIVGGHTVDDKEPKYGLAVTGLVKPGEQVANTGAKPGDALVLTKPIGTGIITTAGKAQRVDAAVLGNAVRQMSALNHAACDAMMKVGVNACADVTGFGLLGHLRLIAQGSRVGARISLGSVPLLEGAMELLEDGIAPGGTHRNLASIDPLIKWSPGADDELTKLLLCDAQTSGGLIIAVSQDRLEFLLKELEAAGVETRAVIGEVVDKGALDGKLIEVVP